VKAFRALGLEFHERLLEAALKPLRQPGLDELYHAIASSSLSARDVVHAVYPELRPTPRPMEPAGLVGPRLRATPKGGVVPAMPVTGLPNGMTLHFAGCCHPIPGDRIVGIVTTGKGVTIHVQDCHMLENFSASPERFLDVDWEREAVESAHRTVRLTVEAVDRPELLSGLANAIAKQKGALTGLKVQRRDLDECDLTLEVEVRDVRHLAEVMGTLRACQGVIKVDRSRG